MRYIKLAALSIADKTQTAVFLALELIAALVIVNVVIGSLNSREMLYEPYEDILQKHGWYMTVAGLDSSRITEFFDQSVVKPIFLSYSEFEGKDIREEYCRIAIMPDDIFERLRFPVIDSVSGENRVLMYSPSRNYIAGETMKVFSGGQTAVNVLITDILTDPSYYPIGTSFSIDGDITMLYRQLSSKTENTNYLIMSDSGAHSIGISQELTHPSSNVIVYYEKGIDSATEEKEELRLMDSGYFGLIPLSKLRSRTEKMISDDIKRYVPLGVVTVIVVIIGTAGAIAIQTLKEMKKYAVYYLCGLKWRKMVLISMCKVLMILTASGLISGTALFVLQSTSIAAKLGMVFNLNNLFASLALVVLTLFSSLLLPFILLRKASPVESLRRIKND